MSNDISSFGKKLKVLRNKRGLSQEAVAKEIDISRASYSHYENDHVQPDMTLISKLATFFKVSSDYLLGLSNDPKLINYNTSSAENSIKTNDGKEINVSDLTDYQQAILQYALAQQEVSFEKKPEDILEMLARFEAFYLREKELEKRRE